MKITNLTVHDPRRNGRYIDPVVTVDVDEPVDEIADPIYPGGRHLDYKWKVIPCGPFVAVEEDVRDELLTDVPNWINTKNIGMFNALKVRDDDTWNLKPYWYEPLYPVLVADPETTHELFMGIQRLRRLMRRHTGRGASGWSLFISDDAALNGQLAWWAEKNSPTCFANKCPRDVHGHVWYGGAHVPTCRLHRADIERAIQRHRAESNHNPERERTR